MKVTELVNRHNTANPFIIAEYENIDVKFVSLPSDLKGLMLSTPNDKPMIWINDNIRDCNLKYLVMAHELKHAMDHSDLIGYYSLCYGGKGKLELEANKFATELMLLLYQEQYQDIPETFDKLIATYGVKEEMREYY
ncbi:ImmA/IrrE family metallo-endopeptidase [uncultured Granulicatella sp.]|uniref:ImmA/IrrE family metallo-endopeptidase n=1 Tax=uncultured Granulicatella sp. TaxID=316089 RepID=UPI0028DCB888|nr:ImmA/IrrE family metallo-endopeptidase [uncultured Granulicatella sp.]